MSDNKIKIPIGENFLVVETFRADDFLPVEIITYIMDKNDVVLQDICLVREHFIYKNENFMFDNKIVDCMVWTNPNLEDYSAKFNISIREDDE